MRTRHFHVLSVSLLPLALLMSATGTGCSDAEPDEFNEMDEMDDDADAIRRCRRFRTCDAGVVSDAGGSSSNDARASLDSSTTPSDATASNPSPPTTADAGGVIPPVNLQAAIDATPAGGTLDLGAGVYTGAFAIKKSIKLLRGTIKGVADKKALTINATDVVVDGLTIDCGVTGHDGIWATAADRIQVRNVNIHDCVYSGIMLLSGVGGSVTNSKVSNIGVVGYEAAGMNAYGIALSDVGGAPATGYTISGNVIDNVPQWHGIDTHGGRELKILDNVIHRCNRAIFLTASSTNGIARNVVVSRNKMDTPTPRVDVKNTYPYNEVGLTVVSGAFGISGDGNAFDGWPKGNAIDMQGAPNPFTNSVITNAK